LSLKNMDRPKNSFPPETGDGEIVLIVDERNRIVGHQPRSVMRRMNLPHRASYILVFDRNGRLFIHRRSRHKDVFPGYYDIAAGGVVKEGETYRRSAERELYEELGIRGVPLIKLFDSYYNDESCRVWGRVYRCEFSGQMTLQKEEVESGFFAGPEKVLAMSEKEPFTPDGLYVLIRFLKASLLSCHFS